MGAIVGLIAAQRARQERDLVQHRPASERSRGAFLSIRGGATATTKNGPGGPRATCASGRRSKSRDRPLWLDEPAYAAMRPQRERLATFIMLAILAALVALLAIIMAIIMIFARK